MGPLQGVRVVEMAGIGPAPFAAMMLADMGADVIRVDRVRAGTGLMAFDPTKEVMNRSRRSVAVELKDPAGLELVLSLIDRADIVLEGFRPGVMERLGLGPDICHARNPRLVYGRMTGWGQEGPLAHAAGHDINYIALAGVLHSVGRAGEPPTVPLNLAGDFGGGGMMLAFGVLAAHIEALRSGQGQVVDAAMVDGASLLMTFFHGLRALGLQRDERGVNLLDGGAPFYDTFETLDGKYIAIGPIESHFYDELLATMGYADDPLLKHQLNFGQWPAMKERFAEIFRTKTRDAWCELLEGTDVCFSPVLSMSEAPHHPHAVAREAFVTVDGITQPAPAPRFSRTPGSVKSGPATPGQHSTAVLRDWGFDDDVIARWIAQGVVADRGESTS